MSALNGTNGKAAVSPRQVLVLFEANMSAALRSHYRRAGAELATTSMPFDQLLRAEDDGIEGGEEGAGDYEMRQRVCTARAILRYLYSDGYTMARILKRLFAMGRAMQDPFFSSLTMTEAGLMFSETKAAHSWRCKVLSGQIKLAGMSGIRLPGQKTPEASASYRRVAKGNKNRSGSKSHRQKSFLKQLHVGKTKI